MCNGRLYLLKIVHPNLTLSSHSNSKDEFMSFHYSASSLQAAAAQGGCKGEEKGSGDWVVGVVPSGAKGGASSGGNKKKGKKGRGK